MSELKKAFILYYDYEDNINLLSQDEKGNLLDAIFEYSKTQILTKNLSPVTKMAFSFIKNQLDRDAVKYQAIVDRNKENGKKPKKAKKASGLFGKPDEAKKADTDTDIDTDIEKINKYNCDFENFWKIYPVENRTKKEDCKKIYIGYCKSKEHENEFFTAFLNYKSSKKFKDGFIQNSLTWFRDWQPWLEYTPEIIKPVIAIDPRFVGLKF